MREAVQDYAAPVGRLTEQERLWTLNGRDFTDIPGVELYNPR